MDTEAQTVDVVEEKVTAEPEQQPLQDEKKYTDAEVDEIINKKYAKWKATQEKEQSEAKKLVNMSADEKTAYENEQLKQQIAELQRTQALSELADMINEYLEEKF